MFYTGIRTVHFTAVHLEKDPTVKNLTSRLKVQGALSSKELADDLCKESKHQLADETYREAQRPGDNDLENHQGLAHQTCPEGPFPMLLCACCKGRFCTHYTNSWFLPPHPLSIASELPRGDQKEHIPPPQLSPHAILPKLRKCAQMRNLGF